MFSKILLAQAITVVLALLVVAVVTRVSLHRGFSEYLERQEAMALNSLAPALADLYADRGSWDFLRDNPRAWESIWRQTRPFAGSGPGSRRNGPQQRGIGMAGRPSEERLLRWMRSLDRPMFRERLFLLDARRDWVAGAPAVSPDPPALQAVEADGAIVGWIGFIPAGAVLPPDARRFMEGQLRVLAIALLIALSLAAAPGLLLARHLARPVRQLAATVDRLAQGHYGTRAEIGAVDEIGSLAVSVNQLATSLERNRTARQRWMADIAHELRTPVAILKGEMEALGDGVREPDERLSASLREEIDQLAALIDDLQALGLADAGALDIRKQPVDLAELLAQSLESFAPRLRERGLRVRLEAPGPAPLNGDPQRLRQLLHNLLENSCRYVETGGEVRLSLQQKDGGAELLLDDSGPGVGDDQLGRLFERFYRAEGSRSRATGGSGLGLSICRNITEAHGGRIEALHSPLGGLRIRVSLPH
jgi:two-component system sensor histidine kinase BaeS